MPRDRPPPLGAASSGSRPLARAAPWLVLLAGIALSAAWQGRYRVLYGPEIDRSTMAYWAQSVAGAEASGLGILLREPRALVDHPETALYHVAALPYDDRTRVLNLSDVVPMALWLGLFGSGMASVLALGFLMGWTLALALATIAVPRPGRSSLHAWGFVTLALFCQANPYLLFNTLTPGWHGFALLYLAGAVAVARRGGSWRVSDWSWGRGVAVWILLALALYSVYLMPVLFVLCWGLCDLVAAWRERPAARRRLRHSLSFWVGLAVALAPGMAFFLTATGDAWTRFNQHSHGGSGIGPHLRSALGASFGLPLLAILVPERRRFLAGLAPVSGALAVLGVMLYLDDPTIGRLACYLLPLAAWAGGCLWLGGRVGRALVAASTALVLASQWAAPERLLRDLHATAWQTAFWSFSGEAAATAVASQLDGLHESMLAFDERDRAVLVLARLDDPPPTITNLGEFLAELERDGGERYFRQRLTVSALRDPVHLLLHEATPPPPDLERWFEVTGERPLARASAPGGREVRWRLVTLRAREPPSAP